MRCFLSIAATLIVSAPLVAAASKNTCTTALMAGTDHGLYRALRVSPAQAHELQSIRYQSAKRRARIQRELNRVRQQRQQMRAHPRYRWRLRQLAKQERKLVRQLHQLSARAPKRALKVLAPWQQRKCAVMTAPPEYRRTYVPAPRRPVRRHYAASSSNAPMVRRAVPVPAQPRPRATRKTSVRLALGPVPFVKVTVKHGR